MRVGLCSIGAEVVSGDQVDTNAAWLSRQLRELGVEPAWHVAVGDDEEAIATTLAWLCGRCQAVIVGGGLGPTSDDRTREAVAAAAGIELRSRPDLEETIRERFNAAGIRMPASNLRQARVPRGADVYPPVGTAPGFRISVDGVPVFVLPGVPWEMKAMFERDVAPALAGAGSRPRVTRIVHVTGASEAGISEAVDGALGEADDVEIAYLATGRDVEVKLLVPGDDRESARARSDELVAQVRDALGIAVAGVDEEDLEHAVVALLRERGETVAVAESATAGLVCARLADVPGASAVLRGGAVVYATDVKASVMGVDEALLAAEGPVSGAVTSALAARAREVFGADWGIGVTGVAGPDPVDDLAVGTVHWATAGQDGARVHGRRLPGDREAVRDRLSTVALDALRRRILER